MKSVNIIMIILWSLIGLLILGAMIGGIAFDWSGFQRLGAGGRNAELVVSEAVSSKGIDTVKIDLSADMCRVLQAEGDEIIVKHYARGINSDRYARVSQENGTLTVSTEHYFIFSSIFSWNNYSMIEIYLPEAYREKLDVDISSGTLTIEDKLDLSDLGIKLSSGTIRSDYSIKASAFNVGVTSGSIKLVGGLDADVYDVGVNSGTVNIDGLKGSGSIGATSGTVRLSGVDIKDHLNVKVTSGTINIGIAGDPALEFTGHKSSGTIRTYFADFRGDDSNCSAVTGEAPYKKLDVRVTSGTIRITQD